MHVLRWQQLTIWTMRASTVRLNESCLDALALISSRNCGASSTSTDCLVLAKPSLIPSDAMLEAASFEPTT